MTILIYVSTQSRHVPKHLDVSGVFDINFPFCITQFKYSWNELCEIWRGKIVYATLSLVPAF